jgi:hypothetical protein
MQSGSFHGTVLNDRRTLSIQPCRREMALNRKRTETAVKMVTRIRFFRAQKIQLTKSRSWLAEKRRSVFSTRCSCIIDSRAAAKSKRSIKKQEVRNDS